MPVNNPSGFNGVDDGTYITVSYCGTDLYRIRKADGQLEIEGGLTTDASL